MARIGPENTFIKGGKVTTYDSNFKKINALKDGGSVPGFKGDGKLDGVVQLKAGFKGYVLAQATGNFKWFRVAGNSVSRVAMRGITASLGAKPGATIQFYNNSNKLLFSATDNKIADQSGQPGLIITAVPYGFNGKMSITNPGAKERINYRLENQGLPGREKITKLPATSTGPQGRKLLKTEVAPKNLYSTARIAFDAAGGGSPAFGLADFPRQIDYYPSITAATKPHRVAADKAEINLKTQIHDIWRAFFKKHKVLKPEQAAAAASGAANRKLQFLQSLDPATWTPQARYNFRTTMGVTMGILSMASYRKDLAYVWDKMTDFDKFGGMLISYYSGAMSGLALGAAMSASRITNLGDFNNPEMKELGFQFQLAIHGLATRWMSPNGHLLSRAIFSFIKHGAFFYNTLADGFKSVINDLRKHNTVSNFVGAIASTAYSQKFRGKESVPILNNTDAKNELRKLLSINTVPQMRSLIQRLTDNTINYWVGRLTLEEKNSFSSALSTVRLI